MVKLKPLFFSLLFTFLLFPFAQAIAQEDTIVDEDVVLYDTEIDYSEMDPRIYESQIIDTVNEQDVSPEAALAVTLAGMGVLMIFPLLISLATYIFTSLALSKIGKELGYKNSWFAWMPILNSIMLMQLGEKSAWWILVPFVGQIMMIVAIMRITERRGYDKLLGLIVLTGIGTYVLLYLLAWSPKTVATTTPTPTNTNEISQPTVELETPVTPEQPTPPTTVTV